MRRTLSFAVNGATCAATLDEAPGQHGLLIVSGGNEIRSGAHRGMARLAETMPTDACQWFYECEQCHAVLKPKPGDCCVYCSYGTVPCPPIQERGKGSCCSG